MRPAIKDLLRLSDDRLFEEVATGIRYIIGHAEGLEPSLPTYVRHGARKELE